MQPTPVDVLIPVYNGERWLRESLASIQAQTHTALAIHVVDDGSTDETPTILQKLAAADARIHIHHQRNAGIVEALNHGLARCTATVVARHDADDIAYPQRLARQLAWLDDNPDAVAVGAIARHIDSDGAALGTHTLLQPPEAADAAWFPAREPYLMHPFMMARRQALQAAGGYRAVLHAEDSDLYWRLSRLGRLHNLPEVLGDYRLHPHSVSAASIHNGRLMAVGSQRAALAAQRRQTGRAEPAFLPEDNALLRGTPDLAGMVAQAGAQLQADELEPYALAVAAKLLELASYRPYELTAEDCRWIRRSLDAVPRLVRRVANRRSLRGLAARSAVRLWQQGRHADALALMPPPWLPVFAWRLSVRVAVPTAARQRLHAWLHPPPAYKGAAAAATAASGVVPK